MTNDQMLDHFVKDRWTCDTKLRALTDDWKRTLKKFPRSRYRVQPLRCRDSYQDYLCVHLHVGKDIKHGVIRKEFAVVPSGRIRLYITSFLDYTHTEIHTTHFFERYRERTNRPHLTMEQTLGEFFYNTLGMATIYNDGEHRMVYATADGICLCEYDDEKEPGKIYFRTFVSYDMLKQTQEQAWQIMQLDLMKLRDHSIYAKDPGSPKWIKEREDLIISMGSLNYETAAKIYSQYFEK